MKTFLLCLFGLGGFEYAVAQTCTATITASGTTSLCPGGTVQLSAAPVGNPWAQKGNFAGSERIGATSFSIGNKGYMGTGYDNAERKDFWEYDPANDTWTQKANFGGKARVWAVGFNIGNKGYIGTGTGPFFEYYNDFWEYDPALNTWTQKANFGGTPRRQATGFSIGNKGYIGTGLDDYLTNDFWEYDPVADNWTRKADFGGTPRWTAASFSIGNKGYIGTGRDNTGTSGDFNSDFWEYDPSANSWSQKADFAGIARIRATAFSIGTKGYLGIGFGTDRYLKNDLWEYNPASNSWIEKESFAGGEREFATVFSIDSKAYIGTGERFVGRDSNNLFNDFWEFDPAGHYSYLWSNGATTPQITVNTGGSYTVTVTNDDGCSAVSAPLVVRVLKLPTFATQVINAACNGAADGRIIITAAGGNGHYEYSINNGASFVTGNVFKGLVAGTYPVVIRSNGCISAAQSVTVGTRQDLVPPVIACQKNIMVEPASLFGTVVRFAIPTATDNCGVATVKQIAGLPGGSLFPIGKTRVSFKATDQSGNASICSFTVTVNSPICNNDWRDLKIFICHKGKTQCVGLFSLFTHLSHGDQLGACNNTSSYNKSESIPSTAGITVYPNPTGGLFTVQLNNFKISSPATVIISDVNGRLLERRNLKEQSFQSTQSFNLGKHSPGIYIVQVTTADAVYTTKIMLQ